MAKKIKISELDGKQRSEVVLLTKKQYNTLCVLQFQGSFKRFDFEILKDNVKSSSDCGFKIWDKILKFIFCSSLKAQITYSLRKN